MPESLPTLSEIEARVLELGRKELGETGELPEGELLEALDSVQKLTLVVAIEDDYRIIFEPEDDEGVASLAAVAKLVHQKLEAKRLEASEGEQ